MLFLYLSGGAIAWSCLAMLIAMNYGAGTNPEDFSKFWFWILEHPGAWFVEDDKSPHAVFASGPFWFAAFGLAFATIRYRFFQKK